MGAGAQYNVTVAAQPTNPSQTCVVDNGTGTIDGAAAHDISITCTTKPGRFLYTTSGYTIAEYNIDSGSGAVTPVNGSPLDLQSLLLDYGAFPGPLTVDPSGTFAYTIATRAKPTSQVLISLSIDRDTGLLSISGPLMLIAAGAWHVGLHPSGRFAYIAASKALGMLLAYARNPTTGELTEINGSPFMNNHFPNTVAVEPQGKFAYTTNQDKTISTYNIDRSTGALLESATPPVPAGQFPSWLAFHPTGKFLYVPNNLSNDISAYRIDPHSGTLTPIAGSAFEASGNPAIAVVEPSGRFLYVASFDSGDISVYSIDASTGGLKTISGSPFHNGSSSSIAVDPTGRFLYSTTPDGITGYEIDNNTGALRPLDGSPFASPTGAWSIVITN
jgi:6-phosphogluconolactonase (cycloisomerase 2 family)